MKAFRHLVPALLGLAVLAFGFYPNGSAAQTLTQQLSAESALKGIQKNGVMKVGLSTFIPWAMRSTSGELIGFEIDVANKIAKGMGGVKAEFVPTAFDGIIPGLLTGKFDIIISGLAMVPKRALSINYTIPYQSYGGDMILSKEISTNIKKVSDLNQPGIKLATRRGSFGVATLKRIFPKAQILQFDDDQQAMQDVINGKVHGTGVLDPKPHFIPKLFLIASLQAIALGWGTDPSMSITVASASVRVTRIFSTIWIRGFTLTS